MTGDDRFKIVFEQAEDGSFIAYCPNLTDCRAQGKNYLEALQKLKQLIVKRMKEEKK